MHRACGGDFEGKYIRDMRRATLLDSSSTAWGLNSKDDTSGILSDVARILGGPQKA